MTAYAPQPARIIARHDETPTIATFTLRLERAAARRRYRFALGQFNMLSAFGVGEVPISIVSDPDQPEHIEHTIRLAGRVTRPMLAWRVGEVVGLRGPYGTGWPVEAARGRDVIIITGGIGCAPVAGVVSYIFRRREAYGDLQIVHGVRTPNDLLYRERFEAWRNHPRTRVLLTTDQPDRVWRFRSGVVTELLDELVVTPAAMVMMCGPEVMMQAAARRLGARGVPDDAMYVSLERNMQCGLRLCGHCQLGPYFACSDGPVFPYRAVRRWLGAEAR